MDALVLAVLLQVSAGCAALILSNWPRAATIIGAGGAVLGSLLGLAPAINVLSGAAPESLRFAWDAAHGVFAVEIDALSAFFLVPVLGLSALAAVYGGDYLLVDRHRKSLGGPWFFFNLFVAGMVLVLVARTVFLFLAAWEIMSLAGYGLVTFEHERAEVRQAGWIYLIATHLGVAFLLLAFGLLGRNAGSLEFEVFRALPAPPAVASGAVFLLALVGFGAKAGFVPFHVWLPEAHPAAPSHVSALMSGVMVKMGIYGLLRIITFLGTPALWWGPTLAALGLLSGLVGIALAMQQRDMKRVLAYSSIENMGLIGVALGVGLWGWAGARPEVAVLGMTAGLFHIWNHALMKGLLFFAAGSVVHGTGVKDMEKLGGLMQRMPWTAGMMMAGAVAIAALPPLNGFVGKWLIYLGLLQCGFATTDSRSLFALFSVGLMALIGGLAAIAFVRMTGIVLLGSPRSEAARHAHESSPWLLGPMAVLVVLCLGAAVAPQAVAAWMAAPLQQILDRQAGQRLVELESSVAPLAVVGNLNAIILAASALGMISMFVLSRKGGAREAPTWGCGYLAPTVRMEYTVRSFAEMIGEHLLPRFLRPHTMRQAPRGLFPDKSLFEAACPDPVTDKVYEPFFRSCAERCSRLRILQQGKIHVYLVYIAIMVVSALAWVALRTWWAEP